MYLLVSVDDGEHFDSQRIDDWEVGACVMSSAGLLASPTAMYAAWETKNEVKFARIDGQSSLVLVQPTRPVTNDQPRKHPVLARNSQGQSLLVWTEGTGWQKGGAVAWQMFDSSGHPLTESAGRQDNLPVWSFPAVFAESDGHFTIVY